MSLILQFNPEKVHFIYPEASMVPAMDIWQLPKNKRDKLKEYCDSGDYLASKKVDGYFYTLNRTDNFVYLFSRKPGVSGLLTEKIDNVPHIKEAALSLPADTLLVGEIYIPGKTSKDVTRIMGCLYEKAIERQKSQGFVSYYLNDIILYGGKDLRGKPFSERIVVLQEVYKEHFSGFPYIELAENIDENIYETAMSLLDQGEEGMVLKKKTATYECGKRPAWSSIKIKQENTIDVIITGFCDPTREYKGKELDSWEYWETDAVMGTSDNMDMFEVDIPVTKHWYYGWKNAIEVSAYDENGKLEKIGTVASGLTDELREAFAKTPEKYLNKVVEIKCMSLDNKEHTLRHGYFVRFRDDKNPEDCKIKEIFS